MLHFLAGTIDSDAATACPPFRPGELHLRVESARQNGGGETQMISDEDVRQLFQSMLNAPAGYVGPNVEGMMVQIFRGAPWKDEHPGACQRHMTVFNKFGVIPKHCFDCYKVVIMPRTVVELFKLLMVFEKVSLPNDNTRKVTIEMRADCSGAYKGFVYSRSIEEGKEARKVIRNAVSCDISPKVPVTLKRGCSEYARAYPRYAEVKPGVAVMRYNEDWQAHEDFVDRNFTFPTGIPRSNIIIINATYTPVEIYSMQYWLRYAATIGDVSYLPLAGRTLPPIPQLNHPPFTASPKKDKYILE